MLTDTRGVHHLSTIVADPQENADFYAETLGLRVVRRTVNFEEPFVYHLYYGDERATPGTVLTFFPYPRERPARRGRPEIRDAKLSVPEGSLDYWRERLDASAAAVEGIGERFGERALRFADPHGTRLALVEGEGPGAPFTGSPVSPERAIRGCRGVTALSASPYETAGLLQTFGYELEAEEGDRVRYRNPSGRESVVDLLNREESYGREGAGSIHHVALGVESEAQLHEWRDLLAERDYDVSRVKDRHFFHSLYVRDPGGILFELATEPTDLAPDDGRALYLPPWLEEDREMIAGQLPPVEFPER